MNYCDCCGSFHYGECRKRSSIPASFNYVDSLMDKTPNYFDLKINRASEHHLTDLSFNREPEYKWKAVHSPELGRRSQDYDC